jgi:hypothetical protein
VQLIEGHGYVLDPAKWTEITEANMDDALDEARDYLVDVRGFRRRAVERALLDARAELVWYSHKVGFTHDCSAHDPGEATTATCDPDARRLPMVLGLPDAMTTATAGGW